MRASSVSSPAVSPSVVRYGGKANAGLAPPNAISSTATLPDFKCEPIEISDAVGLRPKANAAGVRKCGIDNLEQGLPVERDAETRVIERHSQSAPLSRRDGMFDAVVVCTSDRSKRRAPAVLYFVQHHVVLERVRSNDVIVVFVAIAPNQAGSLIYPAGHRLKPHLYVPVSDRLTGKDRSGKRPEARSSDNCASTLGSTGE